MPNNYLPDDSLLVDQTHSERQRLADLLAALTPEQWAADSLCAGWRVREVVAHMTMPFRTSAPRVLVGIARARFDFDRYADRAARADTRRLDDADLLSSLRDNVRHGWRPPRGGQAGALSHDVIHGLDITEALDLPPAPIERIATVLSSSTPRALAYFGTTLSGRTLRATDADVVLGDGPTQIELPAKDLLLAVAGRRPLHGG